MASTHSPPTAAAAALLGTQVAAGRRRKRWTAAELAERVGVSTPTISKIERGDLGVALGSVLEAAVLVGVPLYDVEPAQLGHLAHVAATELALLPQRVRTSAAAEVDDDF